VQSPLWRNPTLGYLSAQVLSHQADEVGDGDVWESARGLGKALTLILDGAYITAMKDGIPVDQYFQDRPEVALFGRQLHELCEKKANERCHEGRITKQGNRIKTWKKRHLRLNSKELVYSDNVSCGLLVSSFPHQPEKSLCRRLTGPLGGPSRFV